MGADFHRAHPDRARAKPRPPLGNFTGLELLLFGLLGAALLDAGLVTWLFVRGVAG